eukprot:CAMPEP_0174698202 /NCGR_PEP_ID=MMETSP1094-20130205/3849_1 /TAXON_ID=156173 /ORGANISM="Chrysochromulina brevifilum, Strain UTEX LB 985" /LENGTH=90 /DNA_ID=CAMNT_0015895323 /DNA_START=397 /DNA_END=666 /DNA_ORIENTATION=-
MWRQPPALRSTRCPAMLLLTRCALVPLLLRRLCHLLSPCLRLAETQEVAHPRPLRSQILDVLWVGNGVAGNALDDAQPIAREACEFLGVV